MRHNTDGSAENDVTYTFEYDALGRKVRVKVGNATLSENEYQNDPTADNFGTLTKMTYGNGDCVRNRYDDFNRITGVMYNSEADPRYEYTYNAQGQVAHVRNNLLGRVKESEYDLADRPCRVKTHTDSGAHVYTGEVAYDDVHGTLAKFVEKVGVDYDEYITTFGYDAENRPTTLTYGSYGQTTQTYDLLGRVRQSSVKAGEGVTNTTTYAFEAGGHGDNSTTGLVKSISQTGGNFAYTYDDNGNITSVVQDGKTTAYTYDAIGQLVRVDDEQEDATWVYTYDMGGNILSKCKYAYGVATGEPLESKIFTYGNANWRDQLTAVNGVPITYDQIGNPLNDGEWTYTWQNGRQLARMQKDGVDASFVYNEQGLRVQKTVNGVVTNYTLHGKNIVHMTEGENDLHFFYDASNRPAVVVYNGTPYSYVKNLQGDIVAILDATCNVVVSYVYDAWGKPIATTGSMADTLGAVQPFRYRGYVYDEVTGLYYLRSRYYHSVICRFCCADIILPGNLFFYSKNAPVSRLDISGFKDDYATHGAGVNLFELIHDQEMVLAYVPDFLAEQKRIIEGNIPYVWGASSDSKGYDCATYISKPLEVCSKQKINGRTVHIRCETGSGRMLKNKRECFLFVVRLENYSLDEIPVGALFLRPKYYNCFPTGHGATFAERISSTELRINHAANSRDGIESKTLTVDQLYHDYEYVAWPKGLGTTESAPCENSMPLSVMLLSQMGLFCLGFD